MAGPALESARAQLKACFRYLTLPSGSWPRPAGHQRSRSRSKGQVSGGTFGERVLPPSGAGSIAASGRSRSRSARAARSSRPPGRAPLRPANAAPAQDQPGQGPPALRGGLHCGGGLCGAAPDLAGGVLPPSGAGSIAAAIRHARAIGMRGGSSRPPGRAPLRLRHRHGHCGCGRPRSSRPPGRAPLRPRAVRWRPRGLGGRSSRPPGRAPLRQDQNSVRYRSGGHRSSRPPGRAPLRRLRPWRFDAARRGGPPALRGGLHCGTLTKTRVAVPAAGSSRPPGRAPLRRHNPDSSKHRARRVLPPSGAGSIAAGRAGVRISADARVLPPSGAGSIAARRRSAGRWWSSGGVLPPSGAGSIAAH